MPANLLRSVARKAKTTLLAKQMAEAKTRYQKFIADYEKGELKDTVLQYGDLTGQMSAEFLRVPSALRLKADFIALYSKDLVSIYQQGMADTLFGGYSEKDVAELVGWQHRLFKSGQPNGFRELAKVLELRMNEGILKATVDGPYGHKFTAKIGHGLVDEEFSHLPLGGGALQTLLNEFDFKTVLDVGCGEGLQAKIFKNAGKEVTLNDYGKSIYFDKISSEHEVILGDFNEIDFGKKFDCVWASHVLEHQRDVGIFLRKAHSVLADDGFVAISVPPLKNEVVGGHLTLWTPGHLLYNLAINGFDCSDAEVLVYGYNISIIARKANKPLPDDIAFDNGDVDKLVNAELLPAVMREGTDGWDPVLYRLP